MKKNLSKEVVEESDSDESMQDAEVQNVESKGDQPASSEEEATSSDSGSESEDGSEESEEESEDSSASDAPPKKTISQPTSKNKKAFIPPPGFKPSKLKTQPSPAISSALSNLEGKQVFHITAPSYLPLSDIKEINFGKVMSSGEPLLSHSGVDYGLVPSSRPQGQSSETLLVYREETNTFVRVPELGNMESYNIQEIVRLPGLDSQSTTTTTTQKASKTQPATRTRPQPKHLKMRFHPVGSKTLPPETVGWSSESEEEEEEKEVLAFRVPPTKRKSNDRDVVTKEKEKKKKSKTTEKDSSKHRDETDQERKARKEEKKKRKAEKSK